MKIKLKDHVLYITGILLIALGFLLHFSIAQLFLEGEFFYFLRYNASPFILWGFIIAGTSILIIESIRKHQVQKFLILSNQPISYFILLAILLTTITLLLHGIYGVIFVCLIVASSIVITMICSKNYTYLLILIFSIFAILEHLLLHLFSNQISILFARVIIVVSIVTEFYLIVKTAIKMNKKGIKRQEINLFFNFTFIYAFTIYFASANFTRTFETTIQYLRNPNFPYAAFLLLSYATYMFYEVYKNNRKNSKLNKV